MLAFLHQFLPLLHSKSMLLIDDREAKPFKFNARFEKSMRPANYMRQPGRRQLAKPRFLFLGVRAGNQNGHVPELLKQLLEIEKVLRSKDFRRCEHCRLKA